MRTQPERSVGRDSLLLPVRSFHRTVLCCLGPARSGDTQQTLRSKAY
jgi:hypothetical protein